jgi:hypothetical protein
MVNLIASVFFFHWTNNVRIIEPAIPFRTENGTILNSVLTLVLKNVPPRCRVNGMIKPN